MRRCSSTCRILLLPLWKTAQRPRLIPRSRSNIPGSRASRWRSRWPRLCGEPLKPREKLSLKIRQPVRPAATPTSAGSGAAAAPARARESKVTPFESKSAGPRPNAASGKADEAGAIRCGDLAGALCSSERPRPPSFAIARRHSQRTRGAASFRRRWQQEDTLGGSRAPGSRRSWLFWLDQDAVQTGTTSAAFSRSRANRDGLTASSPGDFGAGSSTFSG